VCEKWVLKYRKMALCLPVLAVILAGGALVGTATGEDTKAKKIAAGEVEAKKLLLLMDKDQSGKVSKQEFMSFMEAEFDRLDKDKSGELDVKELTNMQLQVRGSGPHR
jgi:hypothetical protein